MNRMMWIGLTAAVALIAGAFGLGSVQAQPEVRGRRGYELSDFVGRWSGMGSGTLVGQSFATTYILTIRRDGTATQVLDSTVGRVEANCTATVEANGFALVHCVDTTGPFVGHESDTHLVITDGGYQITGWAADPTAGFLLTSTAHRQ
jgi:hypothetical protein